MEPDSLVIYDDIRLAFYWWHFGVDPDPDWDPDPDADPDPAIFIIDLQDANKKLILIKIFCILLFEGTFTSFFKDKKSNKKSQNSNGYKYRYGSGTGYL